VTSESGDGRPASSDNAAQRAGQRALKNTAARAAGELLGKLSSLVLLVVLARSVGPSDVGVYVFAMAFAALITVPVTLGFDPYLVREVARDHGALDRLFFNVLALKTAMAVPVLAVGFVALDVMGYDDVTRVTTYVITLGILTEALVKTLESAFTAHERSDLLALSLAAGRIAAAVLGVLALATRHGVVAVAACYVAGAALYLVLALALFGAKIGLPRPSVMPRRWRALISESMPFAVQDVANAVLFRLDAVLLSLLGSAAAVGRYGACYRLMESTMFVSSALLSAFSAMYVYLGAHTRPTVATVFQSSLKLAFALLLPVAVIVELRAETLVQLLFGAKFAGAEDVLRLLAPVIVLLGIWALAVTLVLSRTRPGAVVRLSVGMVALNAAGNLALIPAYADVGAAAAMLVTEVIFATLVVRRAVGAVGGIGWLATLAGPAAGASAMALPLIAVDGAPVLSGALALVVYAVTLACVERVVAPRDARFVLSMLSRRAPAPRLR
jgi:O-antigen/teichoic acid export membrane protein